jgi:hypothetical protein
MPSTSAKQHRFMQAVAHSPSFAKKAGVSQSVGKDFSAADKGRTFNKGGMMKKGKRFEEGGDIEYDSDKTYSGRFTDDETGGLAENTPTRSTAKAAPAARSRTATAAPKVNFKDVKSGSTSKTAPARLTGLQNETNRRIRAGMVLREDGKPMLDPEEIRRSADKPSAKSKTFKKGGDIMESKKMMGKEVAFMKKKGAPASMIKHEEAEMGMKKGGMPMKDGKPAFMNKFAKGGGIESRGKTKGTVIRMAAGGSVSSRADGIAQRGKTKFTNY